MSGNEKDLAYYRRLPYTLRTEPALDEDGKRYWIAEFLELRGCKMDGQTQVEAVAELHDLFDEFIAAKLESGSPIPEPSPVESVEFTLPFTLVVTMAPDSPIPPNAILSKETRSAIEPVESAVAMA